MSGCFFLKHGVYSIVANLLVEFALSLNPSHNHEILPQTGKKLETWLYRAVLIQ